VNDAVLVAIVAAIPSTLAVLIGLRKKALLVAQEKIAGLEALVLSLAPKLP
jgi:hypothetical protein